MINIFLLSPVPPVIVIKNQLVGASLGTDLVLECETEAYPKPVSYWSRDNEIVPIGELLLFNYYYRIEVNRGAVKV